MILLYYLISLYMLLSFTFDNAFHDKRGLSFTFFSLYYFFFQNIYHETINKFDRNKYFKFSRNTCLTINRYIVNNHFTCLPIKYKVLVLFCPKNSRGVEIDVSTQVFQVFTHEFQEYLQRNF